MLKHYLTLLIITIFMVGAVVYAFFNGGSPGSIKAVEKDQRTVVDIQSLTYSIDNYTYSNYKLPESLDQLTSYTSQSEIDGEEKSQITYQVNSPTTYSLCAEFATESSPQTSPYMDKKFQHGKGYVCFDLTSQTLEKNQLESPQPSVYSSSTLPVNQLSTPLPMPSAKPALDTQASACSYSYTVPTKNSAGKLSSSCIVWVNGLFTLAKSYCQSSTSKVKISLREESFGSDRYTTELSNLVENETITAYVTNQKDELITCTLK